MQPNPPRRLTSIISKVKIAHAYVEQTSSAYTQLYVAMKHQKIVAFQMLFSKKNINLNWQLISTILVHFFPGSK